MLIGTKAYSGFINQLRTTAINADTIEKRKRVRDNMLRVILYTFDVSSAYICQHNFDRKISTVKNDFMGGHAKLPELESDLGSEIHEDDMGSFLEWLHGDYSVPRVIYQDDLTEDDPEYIEYETYGISTALMSALYFEGEFWGYLEIWDSRRNRNFIAEEIALVQQISRDISDTIMTAQG